MFPKIGEIYRNQDGEDFRIVGLTRDHENGGLLVTYLALEEQHGTVPLTEPYHSFVGEALDGSWQSTYPNTLKWERVYPPQDIPDIWGKVAEAYVSIEAAYDGFPRSIVNDGHEDQAGIESLEACLSSYSTHTEESKRRSSEEREGVARASVRYDDAKRLRALVDIVNVAVGIAYRHGWDFNAAWRLTGEKGAVELYEELGRLVTPPLAATDPELWDKIRAAHRESVSGEDEKILDDLTRPNREDSYSSLADALFQDGSDPR